MAGRKVQVSAFAETPMEGVEQFLQIVEQEMPDTTKLADKDVLIAVKSAAIGWVDLLFQAYGFVVFNDESIRLK
jgi:NADPH2:quinone reductase